MTAYNDALLPQQGMWKLIAPDGRTWEADSPLKAVSAEQRERIPADVQLARITAALAEKDDGGKVWVGYAQGMPNGKLHFMETNCDPADIHDTGKPLYKVYRDARPLPPLPKGDE